jgi:hypothetical protein
MAGVAPFGCIIPGCLPNTQFVQQAEDPNKWILPIGFTSESIVIFLTGAAPIPAGQAVGIYLASSTEMAWEFVGHISNALPSSIVQVPFSLLHVSVPTPLVIGLQLDSEPSVSNLGATAYQPQAQARAASIEEIGRRVASDFLTFAMSFAKVLAADPMDPQSVETVYLPADYVSKWHSRLMTKITKDASFWK